MAIARMLKASVIGHIGNVDATVRMMQRAGVIEVTVAEVPAEEVVPLVPDERCLGELEESIAKATFVRDFLKGFHVPDAPLATFVSEKVHMPASEFDQLVEEGVPERLSGECESMAERLAVITRERSRLQRLARDLEPWEGLRLQISQWTGTEHVALFTGTVPASASREIRQALRDAVTDVSIAEIGGSARREAWVVMAHRESLEDVRSALSLVDFVEVGFAGLHDYPAEERARALAALAALDREEGAVVERARTLAASEYGRTVAVVQAMLTRRDAEQVRANFAGTERVFVVEGWIDASERDRLEAALASVGTEVDASFRDPREGEHVPVRLVNHPLVRPFEIITDLYGRPRYGRIDPTPLLAVFFFVFFGICIDDVGYALMLGVSAWLIKTRLDVAPRVRTFMDLLMICSVSAALAGVATRGYFALGVESLPWFLRYEPLVYPLDDVLVLLAISVALGVAHVSAGVVTSAVQRWRDGDVIGALSVDLSTIGLFVAVGVALATPQVVGWLLPASLVAAIVLKGRMIEEVFSRRSAKGTLLGFGRGLLGVYGLVGYASDFLSYTRLVALALASLLVGDVMNRLAGLVADIPFGIGIVAAILILVVGHTFNVAINLIGAFVHPTRLQFVEFFSKFYEGGGRPFAPFARRVKSVVLHPETGAREGGS